MQRFCLVTDLSSREHLGLTPLLGLRENAYLWGNRVPHNATASSIQWTPVVCFFSLSFFTFCLVLFVPLFPGNSNRREQWHFLIWLHFLFCHNSNPNFSQFCNYFLRQSKGYSVEVLFVRQKWSGGFTPKRRSIFVTSGWLRPQCWWRSQLLSIYKLITKP